MDLTIKLVPTMYAKFLTAKSTLIRQHKYK